MAGLSKPERRFQALLQALPDEYFVIRDAIDAQDNPDVERGLQKLQEKEAQLKAGDTATALWADKRGQRSMNPNRGSLKHRTADTKRHYRWLSSSDSDNPPHRTAKCFLCNGAHFVRDCEFLPDAQQDARKKNIGIA